MGHYLAERYLSSRDEAAFSLDAQRLRAAAAQFESRLLETLYCADDETCFYLFESASREHVDRTGSAAGLDLDRILAVSSLDERAES